MQLQTDNTLKMCIRDSPYSKPDAPGLAAEEVSRLLEVKKKGQNAIAELKKMAEACAVRCKLEKCMSMSWLDGSNTKTRRYLWAPLKYGKYADNPVTVSYTHLLDKEDTTSFKTMQQLMYAVQVL